jgi:hypothetical protein
MFKSELRLAHCLAILMSRRTALSTQGHRKTNDLPAADPITACFRVRNGSIEEFGPSATVKDTGNAKRDIPTDSDNLRCWIDIRASILPILL